jgi:hypothetical protein
MEILMFFIEIFIAVLLSVSAVVSLKRPLAHLLSELCGTTQRAEFWARYTNIMLFITPLLGVITFGRTMPSPRYQFYFPERIIPKRFVRSIHCLGHHRFSACALYSGKNRIGRPKQRETEHAKQSNPIKRA